MAIALPRCNTEQLCHIFFAYSLDSLPSVLVKWLREAVTEPYDRFGLQQVDLCPVQADVLQPITAKQSRTSARDSEKL